jgi:hypothetical protein
MASDLPQHFCILTAVKLYRIKEQFSTAVNTGAGELIIYE